MGNHCGCQGIAESGTWTRVYMLLAWFSETIL